MAIELFGSVAVASLRIMSKKDMSNRSTEYAVGRPSIYLDKHWNLPVMSEQLLLEDDQYIYRFVSFYELYQLHKEHLLKLTLLAVQEDKNEGVGATLRFAAPEWAGLYRAADKVSQQHTYAVHNMYITCWTTDPESVAMWLLYSPGKDGVRVRTTVGKLKSVLSAYEEANSWTKHCGYTDGTDLLTWGWDIKQVEYADLDQLLEEINSAYADFKLSCSEAAAGNPEWWTNKEGFLERFPKFIDEFRSRFGLNEFVKDSGFAHEKELRGVVRAGIRNSLEYDAWRNDDDPMRMLFRGAEPGVLPEFTFAPVGDEFIDELCFDPRMPEYKREVMMDALSPLVIPAVESRCFSSLVDKKLRFDPMDGISLDVAAQQGAAADAEKRRG